MTSERPEDENMPEATEPSKLKRGRGLRLSVSNPPPEEPLAPAVDPPATPAQLGKGLQLSTQAEATSTPPLARRSRRKAAEPAVEPSVTETPPVPLAPPPPIMEAEEVAVDAAMAAVTPPIAEVAPVIAEVEVAAVEVAPIAVETEVPTTSAPIAVEAEVPVVAVALITPVETPTSGTVPQNPVVDHGPVVVRQIVVGGHPYTLRQVGSGPPLLMLHGWGGSSQIWLPVMSALGQQHTCYAPDLPGFGATPPFSPPANLDQLGQALLTFADALGIERFDLMGHSYGAAVATWIASHHPRRINRLVLLSFGVRRMDPTRGALTMARGPLNIALGVSQPWLTLWRPWVTALMTAPLMPEILAGWLTGHPPEDEELFRASLTDVVRADPRSQLASIVATGDPSLLDTLTKIMAPTLLVSGDEDRLIPEDAVRTAYEQIRDGRLVLIKECGHLPTIERSAVLLAELQDFLR